MIRLVALGSGSGGNAFAIEGPGGVALVDAGFSAKELLRRATLVDLDLRRLQVIALTHEHGDHTSGARRLADRFGAPIAATEGTLRAVGVWGEPGHAVLRSASVIECGDFALTSCRTLHDAIEPAALVVEVADARIGFAYDFGRPTVGLRHLLRDCDALVLEANYDDVLLRTSTYPASVQHRIAGSGGHMSNRAAGDLAVELWHPGLALVLLAHLSQQCNTPEVARAEVGEVLRTKAFAGVLAVAAQQQPTGPFPIRPSYAKYRTSPQVELELS